MNGEMNLVYHAKTAIMLFGFGVALFIYHVAITIPCAIFGHRYKWEEFYMDMVCSNCKAYRAERPFNCATEGAGGIPIEVLLKSMLKRPIL